MEQGIIPTIEFYLKISTKLLVNLLLIVYIVTMCKLKLPFCTKRQSTYIATGSSFFLMGVEYAVIIPTLNLYLASMDASAFFMGFCLSAMSLTNLISAPIYGRITDITRTTKTIVVTSNLFAVGGNFLYALSTNPYMVIISRLIVGIAAGSASSIISMISSSTTKEERTGAMSKIFAGRQTGLVIGPAFNLFLKNSDFYIFSIHVNSYNSPGFFMATLWILETVLMIFFYYDLEPVNSRNTESNSHDDVSVATSQEEATSETSSSHEYFRKSFLSYVYIDLFTEESILFMFIGFVVMFVQVGMEAAVTPLTKIYFDWGEVNNSIYYAGQGALYVVSLMSISFVSKKIRDRYLIIFGLTSVTLCSLLFVIVVTYANHQSLDEPPNCLFALFILYGVLTGLTMPYSWVPLVSLFTKFTSEANQGFTQGVRIIFNGLGRILGPIWASSLLNNLIVMTTVNFALYILVMIMLFASYKHIVHRDQKLIEDESSSVAESEESATEASPLLKKTQQQLRC